ncbi:5-formyltetrahydrofolate cyclo-ligase [Marmoricola endophyticus]|uniref:5-formyltetrahydrofolate cyclo-ligase n=1 Tax=Marmoricola endophyticus TaxID=2040280 RepID=A0A917BMW9_9ACTN|nr:5-formyltetrahydrofolate cyclo-ligase [Marmoricola endophyticus]GGF52281.1 5-formyltetrahydrofolate cyclo-ligase [Marmoricola endophyticus]
MAAAHLPDDRAAGAKLALRDQLLTARGRLPVAVIAARARSRAEHLLATEEVRRAATVAAYVSVGREPGTGPLLDALVAAGKRVVLPLLLADMDLDWGVYRGPESLVRAGRGLLEPAGEPLGADAVATADVVLVPGLAVDRTGVRLGRGGGSYDRALGRVPVGTFTCVLLDAAEILDDVPHAPHDRPVTAVATEDGVLRLR